MAKARRSAVWTQRQATLLAGYLGERGHASTVRAAMRYGQPSWPRCRGAACRRATRVLVLPLYPQYAAATTPARPMRWLAGPPAHAACPSCGSSTSITRPGYIAALADRVQRALARQRARRAPDPELSRRCRQRSLQLGDPYHCHCLKTARLLGERLGLAADQWQVTFQSRFGKRSGSSLIPSQRCAASPPKE